MLRIYSRVSTNQQNLEGQDAELRKFIGADPHAWYSDKATGKNLNRSGWSRLWAECQPGDTIIVWRLDRLGRNTRELLNLFAEMDTRRIGFRSLRDCIDLSTASGRLMLSILAAVATFETEIRNERQQAGIQACRDANGGKAGWGGRKLGTKVKCKPEIVAAVKRLHQAGESISAIARVTKLSRPTVYAVLRGGA